MILRRMINFAIRLGNIKNNLSKRAISTAALLRCRYYLNIIQFFFFLNNNIIISRRFEIFECRYIAICDQMYVLRLFARESFQRIKYLLRRNIIYEYQSSRRETRVLYDSFVSSQHNYYIYYIIIIYVRIPYLGQDAGDKKYYKEIFILVTL